MHWTLEAVEDLDEDVYVELVAWLNEQAEAAKGEGDGIDMDAHVAAITAKAKPDA